MKKKFTLMLLIVIVAVIGLSTIHAADEGNKTTLSIQAEQPVAVGEMVNMIKTTPFFKNYDSNALNWLKEFDSDHVVFSSKDYYIVMNSTDADKLPKTTTTGISVNGTISCNVLENKSMGKGLNNIIHVQDVELVSENIDNFKFSK